MGLTKSQKKAFQSITTGANLFLTGKGGTGKSYVIDRVKEWCTLNGLTYLVCAPTGIAALNVGGTTIHKAFKPGGVGIIEPDKTPIDPQVRKRFEKIDLVIIDEISMCRADLFKFVAKVLFNVWKRKPQNKRKQLVVVGDFYQLSPVIGAGEAKAYEDMYGDMIYAFQTPEWSKLGLETFELQESMRQEDRKFIAALDNIREGIADLSVFQSSEPEPKAITICGKNAEADEINQRNLGLLIANKRKKRNYRCEISGHVVESDYKRVDETLNLAIGARVIMMNNDSDKRWVNGSFGTVTGLSDNTVSVQIDGGKIAEVERYKWEFEESRVVTGKDGQKRLEKDIRATIRQFPMRLGWATTIHKSQGQTYDAVNVDIRSIFCKGQLYVALSRCKTLEGMHIIGEIDPKKVMVDDVVKQFMQKFHEHHENPADLTGPRLPFEETEKEEKSEYDQGYDVGYDEGYHDGEEFTKNTYLKMVAADPAVKMLSPRVAREREKDMMPPEERNKKGAGRPKKEKEDLHPTKAIRVPESVAGILKEMGDMAKTYPVEWIDGAFNAFNEYISQKLDEQADKFENEHNK